MSMLARARPELLGLRGYSSARMEAARARVLLNANESAWPASGDAAAELQRYPEGRRPAVLLARMAAYYGVTAQAIAITRGSDDAIDVLTRAFCQAGRDAVVVMPPTFAMYAVCASIQGARVIEVPLEAGFALAPAAVLAAVDERTKLVFACTPNNPTGGVLARSALLALADALRGHALLVVDEAYVEFAETPSLASEVAARENLAVLRTLSKAHALAGARVGALIAAPEIVTLLERLLPPYPLATPSARAAEAALAPAGLQATEGRIEATRRERVRLAEALAARPEVDAVLPSQANFLTVRWHEAGAIHERLLQRGIVVRDVSRYPGLEQCLRISIGRPDENDALLEALSGRLASSASERAAHGQAHAVAVGRAAGQGGA